MENIEYRVLTLWEPWASLLAYGIKKIETRPSATSWTQEKGAYLIHSAQKFTREQAEICQQEPFKSELEKLGLINGEYRSGCLIHKSGIYHFPLGKIIGAVEIEECCKVVKDWSNLNYCILERKSYINFGVVSPEYNLGDYGHGRYGWICQNPRLLKEPIPYKGGQGYYQKFKGDQSKLIFV